MPKKEKKPMTPKSTLGTWLFRAPIKFSLIFLGVSVLAGVLVSVISALMSPNAATPGTGWTMTVILLGAGLFALYKMLRRIPVVTMGRTDYIAIANGTMITLMATSGVYLLLMWRLLRPLALMMNSPVVSLGTAAWAFGGMIVLAVIGSFMTGLAIANFYATYLRALNLGVPRWKAALSLPFSMFWMAGYVLDDKTRDKSAIGIDNTRYGRLTRRIASSRVATWLCMIAILALSCLFFGLQYALFAVGFTALFAVWLALRGYARMRQNIGGAFATVAVLVNVIMLALLVTMPYHTRPHTGAPAPIAAPAAIQPAPMD